MEPSNIRQPWMGHAFTLLSHTQTHTHFQYEWEKRERGERREHCSQCAHKEITTATISTLVGHHNQGDYLHPAQVKCRQECPIRVWVHPVSPHKIWLHRIFSCCCCCQDWTFGISNLSKRPCYIAKNKRTIDDGEGGLYSRLGQATPVKGDIEWERTIISPL